MNISIRPATFEDMDVLSAFACRVFAENFGMLYVEEEMLAHLKKTCSAEFFETAIRQSDIVLLAVDEGKIAGYTKVGAVGLPIEFLPNAAEIHRLYIDTSYQGKGVGHALMQAVLALPMIKNAPHIYLGVWEHNHRAQAFYKKYGFTEVGEYPYYVGSTVDRELIMRRDQMPEQ